MNQRIVFPAAVIAALFAIAGAWATTNAGDGSFFDAYLVHAVVVFAATLSYGILMRVAAEAAPATESAPAPQAEPKRAGRNRNRNQKREARSERAERKRAEPAEPAAAEEEEPAPSGPRENGHIKWFNGTKGYGFIVREDGSEIFVHHRSINGSARRDLPDGQPVEFVVVERDKGPQAAAVEILGGVPA